MRLALLHTLKDCKPKGLKVEHGGFTALPSGESHQDEEITKN